MKNTTYIRNHFKTSTLPRLKNMKGYTSDKKINECKTLTSILKDMEDGCHSQDELFNRLVEANSNDLEFLVSAGKNQVLYRLDEMTNDQLFELAELLGIEAPTH